MSVACLSNGEQYITCALHAFKVHSLDPARHPGPPSWQPSGRIKWGDSKEEPSVAQAPSVGGEPQSQASPALLRGHGHDGLCALQFKFHDVKTLMIPKPAVCPPAVLGAHLKFVSNNSPRLSFRSHGALEQ